MTPNLSLVIEFSSSVYCRNWYLCFCFLSLFGGFRIICRSRFCSSFAPCRDLKMHSLFLFYCHLALRLHQYIYTVNMPVGNYKAYCHWPRSGFLQLKRAWGQARPMVQLLGRQKRHSRRRKNTQGHFYARRSTVRASRTLFFLGWLFLYWFWYLFAFTENSFRVTK